MKHKNADLHNISTSHFVLYINNFPHRITYRDNVREHCGKKEVDTKVMSYNAPLFPWALYMYYRN